MARYSYPEDFEGTFWAVIGGDYYVSTFVSDINGDGSPKSPCLTVGKAFEFAIEGEKVIIGPDEYASSGQEWRISGLNSRNTLSSD